MITEGTYPYHFGGVSTWCHSLVRGLPHVDFFLMSLISDPRLDPLFALPPNIVRLLPVPLWGILDAQEAAGDFTLADLARKQRTTQAAIAEHLMPAFENFVVGLWSGQSEAARLAVAVHDIHRFALEFDLDTALRSRLAWDCFVDVGAAHFPQAAARHGYPNATFQLADLTTGLQWIRHLLFPISRPLPRVDVVHAAMAGTCTLVAICAKLEHGAAFLLTEHGIFLREAYLAAASSTDGLFLKLLRLRFARLITEMSYKVADQISPCCDYNKRWELRLGADPDRIRTLYYGVDSTEFKPADGPPRERASVVVWVGRINPLKDLRTLVEAANLVRAARPDVRFLLFGSAAAEDEGYHQEILALRAQLGLEEVVVFRGYIAQPTAAYQEGDVVALSSLSEAFPFSILEAMLCGKPVVATAVGGIAEQLEGCGITVEPRSPSAMARGILELLDDPQRCDALGRAARAKAMGQYSIQAFCGTHYDTYARLSGKLEPAAAAPAAAAPVAAETDTSASARRVDSPGRRAAAVPAVGVRRQPKPAT